jgi:hypothetical protein
MNPYKCVNRAVFFSRWRTEVKMTSLELFVWAIAGGILVAGLSALAVLYNKEELNTKHLSRDFILGAATTGFLYPLIPDSFDGMKTAVQSAGSMNLGTELMSKLTTADPGIKIGPANF